MIDTLELTGSALKYKEVQRFVTKIWIHPLLDNATLDHRKKGREKILRFAERAGVYPEDFFAIPIGSCVWVADSHSDHDVILVGASANVSNKLHSQEELATLVYKVEPHLIIKQNQVPDSIVATLTSLITPNDYIIGSTFLADKARLAICTLPDDSSQIYSWDPQSSPSRKLFYNFYLNWRNLADDLELKVCRAGRSRYERFNYALEERAKLARNPKVWKNAFLNNLNQFQLPNLADFKQALIYSKGGLTLDSRCKTQSLY